MREVYKEEDFYKDKGWPSERLVYSKYILNADFSDDHPGISAITTHLS